MKRSSFVKAITLIGFCFFIAAFLFFRSGGLDRYFTGNDQAMQTSPNGGAINTTRKDTMPVKAVPAKTMMSSSKSIVVMKDRTISIPESLSVPVKTDSVSENRKLIMMSGSKSDAVFTPVQVQSYRDSIFKTKPKKKKFN